MDLSGYQLPTQKKVRGGERADLIHQLYELYRGDDIPRKKENWHRYCGWCKNYNFTIKYILGSIKLRK